MPSSKEVPGIQRPCIRASEEVFMSSMGNHVGFLYTFVVFYTSEDIDNTGMAPTEWHSMGRLSLNLEYASFRLKHYL